MLQVVRTPERTIWELYCPHMVAASEDQTTLLDVATAHAVKTTEQACDRLLQAVLAVPTRIEYVAEPAVRLCGRKASPWDVQVGEGCAGITCWLPAGHIVNHLWSASDLSSLVGR